MENQPAPPIGYAGSFPLSKALAIKNMKKELTLENLICLIREFHGIPSKTVITENTLIENDLGITGDDGDDLLEEIEKTFDLSFIGQDGTLREFFDLNENEYLFHSEGFDILGIFRSLFGKNKETVKPFNVGELYRGACRAKNG